MSLTDTARKLYAILAPHGVVIGGVCGALHGVERFTRGVDMATDLQPELVISLLRKAGIEAQVVRGDAFDKLSWVIKGMHDGVEFQVAGMSV